MASGLFNITIPDLAKILATFQGTAREARRLVGLSASDAIKSGRTTLIGRGASNEGIRSRYNLKYSSLLKAIGKPRLMGISGLLEIKGPRLPLTEFPYHDEFPRGVEVSELKGKQPFTLRHAFTAQGHIYERATPHGPRIPIRWIMGLSVAQMAAEKTEVLPKTQARIKEQLYKRLAHYFTAYAQGKLPANIWKGKY